jgi:D-inositol-3-phosphate glycosyltransferase
MPRDGLPRVVLLTTYFRPVIGGVESNTERLARFLARAGFNVRVLTKRVTRDLPDIEPLDGFQVVRIGPYGERGAAGKWRLIPPATRWLTAHAADHDVVCCIDYRGVGCAALAARRRTGHPVVFQAQTGGVLSADNADATLGRVGIGSTSWLGRVLKGLVTRLYRSADAFACISRDIERETEAAGVPRPRIHFLPNPVDMQLFTPPDAPLRQARRRELGLADDDLVCVYVGRLSREKGLTDLLIAWQRLAEQHVVGPASTAPRRAVLVVAGPDMTGHAWDVGVSGRQFVTDHQLGDTVRFIGPRRDVPAVLQAGDIAIVPSHFEALGLSAVEALACGLPVIASSVGGLLDFVIDGENGLGCPASAPDALADRLGRLICDASLRARLAARARESVLTTYDEGAVFCRFAALLTTLAAAPVRGTAAR